MIILNFIICILCIIAFKYMHIINNDPFKVVDALWSFTVGIIPGLNLMFLLICLLVFLFENKFFEKVENFLNKEI